MEIENNASKMEIENETKIENRIKINHEQTCLQKMKSNPIDKYWVALIFQASFSSIIGIALLASFHAEHDGFQLLDKEYPDLHRFCTIFTAW